MCKVIIVPMCIFKSSRSCLLHLEKCPKSLVFPDRVLFKHVKKPKKVKKYKCVMCNKGLDTRGEVKNHCKVHHGQFSCCETNIVHLCSSPRVPEVSMSSFMIERVGHVSLVVVCSSIDLLSGVMWCNILQADHIIARIVVRSRSANKM